MAYTIRVTAPIYHFSLDGIIGSKTWIHPYHPENINYARKLVSILAPSWGDEYAEIINDNTPVKAPVTPCDPDNLPESDIPF